MNQADIALTQDAVTDRYIRILQEYARIQLAYPELWRESIGYYGQGFERSQGQCGVAA